MVTVTIEMSDKLCVTVDGHAGHSEYGTDIVCASASILAYTLAKSVSDAGKMGLLAKEPVIEMQEGHAVISCVPLDEYTASDLITIYEVIRTGYHLLHNNYPRYVEVNE